MSKVSYTPKDYNSSRRISSCAERRQAIEYARRFSERQKRFAWAVRMARSATRS